MYQDFHTLLLYILVFNKVIETINEYSDEVTQFRDTGSSQQGICFQREC